MQKHTASLLLAALCAVAVSIAVPDAQSAALNEEGVALIEKKGPNAMIFGGHGLKNFVDPYMLVTSRTRCFNENGEPISYAALKFPCQARIVYRMDRADGMPEAVSIQVEFYPENREVGSEWNLPVIKPDPPQ